MARSRVVGRTRAADPRVGFREKAGRPGGRPRTRGSAPHGEQGFALLLIFLMAAVVAITLYMEVPRYAMNAQRDKEQTLIDRGEQYKRAIELFVRKAKRYPADIKELESFQNQRFLRRRYLDPMTGKDEWRVIHVQNGVLTDSKVTKPTAPGGKDEPKTPNSFVGELAGLGTPQNPTQSGGAANVRDRRRAGEGANSTMPGPTAPAGSQTGATNTGVAPLPGQTPDNGQQALPGAQPYPVGQTGQPGQTGFTPPGMAVPGSQGLPGQPGMPGFPGAISSRTGLPPSNTPSSGNSFVGSGSSFIGGGSSYIGGGTVSPTPTNPGMTGYPVQGLPGQPGAPVNSQMGGVSPYPVTPGSNGMPPGFPQPGTTTGQGNAAADMIRNILTTPRPGGMPTANMPGAQTIGGGMAGVATTAEGEGVKVYNDRTLYEEWEFIYDQTKQKQIPNPNVSGAGGTPADKMNPGSQTQTPGLGTTPRLPGR